MLSSRQSCIRTALQREQVRVLQCPAEADEMMAAMVLARVRLDERQGALLSCAYPSISLIHGRSSSSLEQPEHYFAIMAHDSDFYVYAVNYVPFNKLVFDDADGSATLFYYHPTMLEQQLNLPCSCLPLVRRTNRVGRSLACACCRVSLPSLVT